MNNSKIKSAIEVVTLGELTNIFIGGMVDNNGETSITMCIGAEKIKDFDTFEIPTAEDLMTYYEATGESFEGILVTKSGLLRWYEWYNELDDMMEGRYEPILVMILPEGMKIGA